MLTRTAFLKVKATAVALILATVGFSLPAQATLVLDVGPGGNSVACSNQCGNNNGMTFGWAFDVNSAIQVGGIGAWDSDAAPFSRDVEAGLWTDAGMLLGSTAISAGSPTEASNGDGVWRVESIATLLLTPGRYVVGLTFFNATPLAQFNTLFTTIPEVTFVRSRSSGVRDGGFLFPETGGGIPVPGLFGPTLVLADPSALPEPATLALLSFGLVGLGLAARRRRTG